MPITRELLSTVDAFRGLSPCDLSDIAARLVVERVARGDVLVRQGEPARALYIVASGRFHVWREGEAEPIAEIGPGSPIGEIGFFAGGVRTATVRAERDSLVFALSRAEFDALAARQPRLWSSIVATLAARLARTTAGERVPRRQRPRTVCLLPLQPGGLSPAFQGALTRELARLGGGGLAGAGPVLVLEGADGKAPGLALGEEGETACFNDIEARHELIVFAADAEPTEWSRKAIRQSDLVLCVADARADPRPGELERLASGLHRPRSLWLVLVRPGEAPPVGTAGWLAPRPWIGQHHHVAAGAAALEDHVQQPASDIARLARFVTGRAKGFVACGGGAFCPAHIGVFEALNEAGIVIDAYGGTSGGAAMAAAFAAGHGPDEIEQATEDIFVRRRAMRRWTLPRYSLLDHTVLEAALKDSYGERDIADLPLPFFAVSTNLSRHETVVHRSGPLWEAIRASSAIPALLPPVITGDGDMLVDGCLLDNVPVAAMHDLKLGPNVVVDFLVPQADRVERPTGELPGRSELAWRSLTRGGRGQLPPGPSPQSVLMRSLMLHSCNVHRRLAGDDVLVEVPMPEGASHLDWHLHAKLRRLARDFMRERLDGLRRDNHPLASL